MLLPPALGFSPFPPVSVYGTGSMKSIAAFLDSCSACFATLFRSASHASFRKGICLLPRSALAPVFPFPAHALPLCPHSSVSYRYRNFNLLSIDYAVRPRLRSRLTQGRSALPWNPWIFGRKDSHLPLATHSGILSSRSSTAPFRYCFLEPAMLLYQSLYRNS